MINLKELSLGALEKIQKTLRIILDALELQSNDEYGRYRITKEKFKEKGLYEDDVIAILNKINNGKPKINVLNYEFKQLCKWSFNLPSATFTTNDPTKENEGKILKDLGLSREDIQKYIVFTIDNANILKQFNKKVAERMKRNKKNASVNTKKKIILCLNKDGDLYREPKKKHCYPMSKEKQRRRIIAFLADSQHEYQPTELLASQMGTNEQTIRTEIGKIRGKIEALLNINGIDVIESKKDSGYRISPKCKIILK